MRITFGKLKQMLKEERLDEASVHYEDVTLTTGEASKYGDSAHVADMEKALSTLETLKNQQKRTTAARSVYASACQHLKSQIKKAKAKNGLMNEVEPMSTEEPGEPRKSKPGHGGGTSTEPGQGRTEPGHYEG